MTTVYRASRFPGRFKPLDASPSVAREGWRFNDQDTPILYAAEVQSLALLEVVARPGMASVTEIAIFPIEIPGEIVTLAHLAIVLPSNWSNRPAGHSARRVGKEFLQAVDRASASSGRVISGVFVPSVISTTDRNVLLDPRQTSTFRLGQEDRIPFDWLAASST